MDDGVLAAYRIMHFVDKPLFKSGLIFSFPQIVNVCPSNVNISPLYDQNQRTF